MELMPEENKEEACQGSGLGFAVVEGIQMPGYKSFIYTAVFKYLR